MNATVQFCSGCRSDCIPSAACACCRGESRLDPGWTYQHYEQPQRPLCGHCHRPITQASRGIAADGTVLCHAGTLPPDAEPADCYRLVLLDRHATDGSCCRRDAS